MDGAVGRARCPWVNALHAGTTYVGFRSVFLLLALLGLLLARRAEALETIPLSAAMLLFPLTYYITHSAIRYGHPIDPVMTILTVYALVRGCAGFQSTSVKTSEAKNL